MSAAIDLLDSMQSEYHHHHSGLWLPYKRRPIAIDLFCGCGGFSLGLLQAGWEVVAAVDWDEAAITTYMVNLGSYPVNIHFVEEADKERLNRFLEREMGFTGKKKGELTRRAYTSGSGWISAYPDVPPVKNVWVGDIRKIRGKDILDAIGMKPGEVDLVAGGPPCQGFSRIGKRDVMDPRNSLVFDFARLVLEIQPKAMCMENVPGILSMVTPEGIPVVDAFCRILEDGGFGTFEALKKSLLMTSGAGAALKGSKRGKQTQQEQVEENEAPPGQLAWI